MAARKSFTVRLEPEDYDRLKALAERRRPVLSLQYLVEYAIQRVLDRADDPQLQLELRDPTRLGG